VKVVSNLAASVTMVLYASCSPTGPADNGKTLPKPGEIHVKIASADNPSRSYALYIPRASAQPPVKTGGTPERLYPVMIAFDPHANGALPLTNYMRLADKYGFIMMGSNDSRNGLDQDEVNGIVSAMVHEARTVYPVDTGRIYFLGFSGGARVASMEAMYHVKVRGVIACGAGFGNAERPFLYKFDYYGIAGTADFNMNELQQLDEPLSRAGFRHYIATFPGIHAWPPGEVMEDGFRWITLNAMRDGQIAKDSNYITQMLNQFNARLQDYSSRGRLLAAADECRMAISFAEGLASTSAFRAELNSLEKRTDYKAQLAYRIKVLKKEEEEKAELMQALEMKDLKWWKKKVSDLGSGNGKLNPEDTLKNRRLLSFLSLFCYMNANAAITRQNDAAAMKIVAIYEMADMSNPEPNFLRAILLARGSENEAAIGQIKIAFGKGFSDMPRMTAQPEFARLANSPGWTELINTRR